MKDRNKIMVCSLILALACAVPAMAGRAVSETRKADSDVEVSVEIVSGSVTVTAWNQKSVSIEGTLGDDVESLEIDGEGDEIRIVVEVPGGDWGRRKLDVSAELEIKVPRGAELEIEALSADVDVSGVTGSVSVEAVSGEVDVSGPTGSLEIASVSGEVRVADPGPDSEIASVSGGVSVKGISGKASVESVSGDLKIDGILQDGSINTVSGSIHFKGDFGSRGKISIDSLSGEIELVVPRDVSARFRVETFSGSIENDFGGEAIDTDQYTSASEMDLEVGGGSARVDIECFSGQVRILSQ